MIRFSTRWRATMAIASVTLAILGYSTLTVQADKFEIAYGRETKNTLVFGEPKFVRAIGMYTDGDSAWGSSFTNHPAFIQLRLYAEELTEELRIVDPYENSVGNFNDTTVDESSKKLIDDIDFPTSDYSQTGFIQAVVLQAQDLDLLGLPDPESPLTSIETYCCTPFYVDQGLCPESELGSLIIDRNISTFDIWTYDIPLLPRKTRAGSGVKSGEEGGRFIERQSAQKLTAKDYRRGTYNVRNTGEHVLILSHCDPTLNTEVAVTGMTEWKNPFGYLPGRLFGFLNFHKYMLLFYVAFGLIWLGLNVKYWKEFTTLQFYTSIVIFMCMAEQITWYSEYDHFNKVGTRHLAVITFGIILSVARQAISRMLIVSVSLGYQIVKPSLGENKIRLIVLGTVYFVLECALELIVRYQQTHPLNDYYRILLTLPVSIMNAIFYWWIFISLYQLMQHLEERKQDLKFGLYRQFTNTLIFSVVAALGFAIYQSYFMLTNQYAWHWSYLWIIDGGFAFFLYTLILVAIAVLFRPSNMSSRYAYAAVGMMDEDDEEDLTMLEMQTPQSDEEEETRKPAKSSKGAKHAVDYSEDEQDQKAFQKEQAAKEKR